MSKNGPEQPSLFEARSRPAPVQLLQDFDWHFGRFIAGLDDEGAEGDDVMLGRQASRDVE